MNGECKAYRLNSPMTWEEFKELPDDLKISYIKTLREKYNAPAKEIAAMMGVSSFTYGETLRRLGISEPPGTRRTPTVEWYKWRVNTAEPVNEGNGEEESAEENCEPETNWKQMCELLHNRAQELQEKVCFLEAENKVLIEENENMRTNPAEVVSWDYHNNVVREQKRQIDILRAKLEIVELIFGKR